MVDPSKARCPYLRFDRHLRHWWGIYWLVFCVAQPALTIVVLFPRWELVAYVQAVVVVTLSLGRRNPV